MRRQLRGMSTVIALLVTAAHLVGLAQAAPVSGPEKAVFARINGSIITVDLYEAELAVAIRNKFYHRRPPQGQLEKLQREVADSLIDRMLLLSEAQRRGIKPDPDKIRDALRTFEERYGSNLEWQKRRDELLPMVRKGVADRNMLDQLERAVRQVPPPSVEQARAYFDAHHKLFTEPERLRVSLILLKVDPGAPQAELDKARAEAKRIRKELSQGADFAALARKYSGDESARNGGDMGYLHRGMLAEAVHAEIDKLAPGALSEPVRVLQGMAILRLEDRQPARLRSFDDSKDTAAKAWQRERAEQQWNDFKLGLRRTAVIEIVDRSRYPVASKPEK